MNKVVININYIMSKIKFFLCTHNKEIEGLALLLLSALSVVSLGVSLSFTLMTLADISFMSVESKLLYASMAAYTSWIGIFTHFCLRWF